MAEQAIDIIFEDRVTTGVRADTRGGALWLDAADAERVGGWTLKPEGLCKGDVCVPVPPARRSEFADAGKLNLAAVAAMLGHPMVADEEHRAWCFGAAAAERKRTLQSLDAPDFTLPDLAGRMHSLSQYRGKKVLLVSWASW